MSLGVQLQPKSLPLQSNPLLLLRVHEVSPVSLEFRKPGEGRCVCVSFLVGLAWDWESCLLSVGFNALRPSQALLCAIATPPELEASLYVPSCLLPTRIVMIRKKERVYIFF